MRFECAYDKLVNIENINPHPYNRNKHPKKQIEALAKVISKNGQRSPIVISNRSNYVVKGHGRLEAMKLLGWSQCAVDYQDYVDETEELRDRIADNEIARYSEFDAYEFVEDLKKLEIDLGELDFEEFGKLDFNILNDSINGSDINNSNKDYSDKNIEINTDNFGNDLKHCCPKCGFEFNE